MRYIADLHIHSPYSRATSKSSNLAGLAAWSGVKGIDVIGTGDFTHPGWFRELRESLKPAEPGFYKLRDPDVEPAHESFPSPAAKNCRFILTAEISSIYKRQGSVRKIHNIIFVPDFESASRINVRLAAIGNIESDGRPILGLDAHDLLEIVLEAAPEGFLVPAHIWTPWFSLFGSKSGFDSIDECFGDLSRYIFALETGLSSDPGMNRLVSALDRYTLISNSDCHSPGKLGREANIFTCGFNFFSMRDALKNTALGGFQGTIEFFPEEGKYHHDGHRKCGINLSPQETRKMKGICPVCSKPLTIGVMHRVMELADRDEPYFPPNSPGYYSLIPLPEVLGEIFSKGAATKTVLHEYAKIIRIFSSEFNLLFNVPVEEINERYSPVLGEAVKRIRKGKVIRTAGFDGEFGVIKVFDEGELTEMIGQFSLFGKDKSRKKNLPVSKPSLLQFTKDKRVAGPSRSARPLNGEQSAAVGSDSRHIVVTAGPGTGKTYTLVCRIKRLVEERRAKAGDITAITFTNRAADEMRDRLEKIKGLQVENIFIGTFHTFCLNLLREDNRNLTVLDDADRDRIIARLFRGRASQDMREIKTVLEDYYRYLASGSRSAAEEKLNEQLSLYLKELERRQGIDLDGIVQQAVFRLKNEERLQNRVGSRVKYFFIDEFQDLNRAQYELVRILANHCSVFAIGDPDQAIYGFRGSSPEYFRRFIEEFGAENILLKKNYRSAKNILQAASKVIVNNYVQEDTQPPELTAEHENQGKIEIYKAVSPQAEAEFVVQRIEELMGGISHFSIDTGRSGQRSAHEGRSFRDFAVLYRLTQQAQFLREALDRRGIPFQMVNVKPFFMQREMRLLYYWIRAAGADSGTPVQTEVYLGLLKNFPGIGESALRDLDNQLPFGGFMDFFATTAGIDLPELLQSRIAELRVNLQAFTRAVSEEGLSAAASGIMDYLGVDRESGEAVRFLNLAGSFGSDLSGFAAYLHKNEAATVYDEKAEAVALMTLHGAKGLEFPVVFITGMEEGIFPCQLHDDRENETDIPGSSNSIEEERRLFYVGMTRAQDMLVLTSAVSRPIFGSYQSRPVSRFVQEIPGTLYEQLELERGRKKKPGAKQMKLF